jgi:hypothetical protein
VSSLSKVDPKKGERVPIKNFIGLLCMIEDISTLPDGLLHVTQSPKSIYSVVVPHSESSQSSGVMDKTRGKRERERERDWR